MCPRRSRHVGRRSGGRGWRWTWTRCRRGASTTSTTRSPPGPPTRAPRRRTSSPSCGPLPYVLWRRVGPTPPLRVIDKDGTPGRLLDCATPQGRRLSRLEGTATVIAEPVTGTPRDLESGFRPFEAPGKRDAEPRSRPRALAALASVPQPGAAHRLAAGSKVDLPPSLDGMYLTHQGQGAFWPAGEARSHGGFPTVGHGERCAPQPAAAPSRSQAAGLAGDAGRHPAGRQAGGIARRLRALRGPLHRPWRCRERESLAANLIRR